MRAFELGKTFCAQSVVTESDSALEISLMQERHERISGKHCCPAVVAESFCEAFPCRELTGPCFCPELSPRRPTQIEMP